MIARFEWLDPKSLDEAFAALGAEPGEAEGAALLKAGGVDVIDRLKEGLDSPLRLVNLRNVPGLDRIEKQPDGGLAIGPLATLAQLDADSQVRALYPALADAAGHAATPNVRQAATIGGNLLQRPRCWYFRNADFHCLKKGGGRCYAQEGENEYHAVFGNRVCAIVHPSAAATALTAIGAQLQVASAKKRRSIAIDDFFIRPDSDIQHENVLGPGEILVGIQLPAPAPGMRTAYLKLGEKESFDWPLAEAAVRLDLEGGVVKSARIVLGAAAPIPWRATKAEAWLVGKALNEDTARQVAAAAIEGATPLAHNAYKLPILETVVRRALLAAGA
jgi:xanthine dehydrogenase YagS FAD-binding subunit